MSTSTTHRTVRRTVRRTAAGLAGTAVMAGAALLGAPQAQAGEPQFVDGCDLRPTVTELQNYGDRTDVNIIVYRADKVDSERFEGVIESGELSGKECSGVFTESYKWVVFDGAGEFDRSGDGGYRNWAFYGTYDRPADDVVVFHAW